MTRRLLDLVVGGLSELQVRVRHQVISAWLVDPGFSTALGLPVAEGLIAFVNGTVKIDVAELPNSSPSVAAALAKAEKLRSLVQKGRTLEPSDLNAAASPAAVLTEAREVALIADAVADLRARLLALQTRLDFDVNVLADAHALFLFDVRDARRRLDLDGKDPALPAILTQRRAAPACAASSIDQGGKLFRARGVASVHGGRSDRQSQKRHWTKH